MDRGESGVGRADGAGIFGGRVGGEPGALVFDEAGGFVVDVANAFEGERAGDVVGVAVGGGPEGGGPAIGGLEEFGELFAEVGVTRTVVVKVVVELVGDGGELLEEVVEIVFAAGSAGLGDEFLDSFRAGVEEFDKGGDAVGGDVGGLAELLDLGVGHGFVGVLGVEGERGEKKQEGGERAEDAMVGERRGHGG